MMALALLLALSAPVREALTACQRARMEARPGREVRPSDACVCRARVGLPETAQCRRMRGQR